MASGSDQPQYDLFVSYARDDPDLGKSGKDWVGDLVSHLRSHFQRHTGRDLDVFFDPHEIISPPLLSEALRNARALLVIASPRFLENRSALREIGLFRGSARTQHNIFLLEAMPVRDGAEYPMELTDLPRLRFWQEGPDGIPEPFGPSDLAAQNMLIELASDIATVAANEMLERAASKIEQAELAERRFRPADSPDHISGVWIFYATEPATNRGWMESLAPGDTIFWRHGKVTGGGSYRRQLRRGDSVLVLVGEMFIASGILLADEELQFVDRQGRVRRPVRIIERYASPLDRAEVERRWGDKVVRQGAVHPVRASLLEVLNTTIATTYVHSIYGGPQPLPFSPELVDSELARQSLLADLTKEAGILPDRDTAAKLGWEGEIWSRSLETPIGSTEADPEDDPEPVGELEAHSFGDDRNRYSAPDDLLPERPAQPDVDARIPFVLDAPADSEDQLDRGPFALFLAQRLHLIWCQMNGHAPAPGGGRTAASGPDADTFIAHVDSPWGGGKTTFANFVARVLDPAGQKLVARHFLRSSLAATVADDKLGDVPLDDVFVPPYARDAPDAWPGARRPWIIARYNAWRDQYVQPPWWQVFLTIQTAVTQAMRREAWASCQKGWRKRRPAPIAHGALLFVRSLRATLERFLYQVWNRKLKAQLLLLAALAVFVLIAARLGAFDAILHQQQEPRKLTEWLALGTAILGVGGASLAALFTVISQSLAPDLDFTAEHRQIGVQDPISRFRRSFHRILAATDRPVLLIVDDLDRCEPRAVVELLRGFQTIIRSPRLFVLLLGDRAWIENAHDVHHKDLAGMREGEGGLGARFVQKVIQLSFRLPTINGDARARFARRVLGDEDPAEKANIAEMLRQVDSRVASIVDQEGSVGTKEAELARVIDAARTELARDLSPHQVAEATNLAEQLANVKLVAAAGADTAQQRSVYNAITQLVGSLPNNPRQIKRIFMAFATYEVVGRVYFGYQLTAEGPDGERKSRRWRQLAMWVTLAIEWPETWRALAGRPALLRAAYGGEEERTAVEAALIAPLADLESKALKAVIQRLRGDRGLRALLTAEAGSVREEGAFGATEMEAEAIYEFNRIIWEPGFVTDPPRA